MDIDEKISMFATISGNQVGYLHENEKKRD